VFTIPAMTWTLTAALLFGGSCHAVQTIRCHHLADRVNESLHAVMNVLMAAMLWNVSPSTMLAQIAVLVGAALWFVFQAVARPEFKLLCAGSPGRLKCVYHSLTMAAAALMIAMTGQAATTGQATVPANGMTMPLPAAQHAIAGAPHNTAIFDHSPTLAILLTIFFATSTVIFLALQLRNRVTKTTPRHAAAARPPHRPEYGLEALGAAVMALMSASMAA